MELQVLVATMDQNDFSLVEKMNIRTNAIIANQTCENRFDEKNWNFGNVKMISTKTRGVGLNRNIALLAAEADILLFADDDMCYYSGLEEGVKNAFSQNAMADVIIFSTDITRNGEIVERRYCRRKRARVWNSMKYGTYAVAIRRTTLLKANLKFNELFGGGCPFSSGEDSLFIKACFDQGLKVYTDPYVLGRRSKDDSSWFTGYNEKFLYDKGVSYGFLFPKMKYIVAVYYGIRFRSKTGFPLLKNISLIIRGAKNGKSLKEYSDR